MIDVIQAPNPFAGLAASRLTAFLSGSIEMGRAEQWQERLVQMWRDLGVPDLVVLNPRRDDWDNSWEQSITDTRFFGQVQWELAGMEVADVVPIYFSPETKAPITLLEFGLYARSGKAIVCCPDGFYRKGNVDIVCNRYHVPTAPTLEELAKRTAQAFAKEECYAYA